MGEGGQLEQGCAVVVRAGAIDVSFYGWLLRGGRTGRGGMVVAKVLS